MFRTQTALLSLALLAGCGGDSLKKTDPGAGPGTSLPDNNTAMNNNVVVGNNDTPGNNTEGAPCISVGPTGLYVSASGGEVGYGQVEIVNCAVGQPLLVTGITVSEGPFGFEAVGLPMTLPAGGSFVLEVWYDSAAGGGDGTLTVTSDGGAAQVSLSGGSTACTQVDALGRMGGDSTWLNSVLVDDSGATAELTGMVTTAGDAAVTQWNWRVLNRPADSFATLDAASGQTTSFRPDAPGDYLIELTVRDGNGSPGCSPDTIGLTLAPAGGAAGELDFRMSWTAIEPGATPDADVHLLHPNGAWQDTNWDVHYANKSPNWGTASTSDDPTLAVDALQPPGPERISFSGLEAGKRYRLGVHNYGSQLAGSEAMAVTAEIYWEGNLLARRTKTLSNRYDMWEVGVIELPSPFEAPVFTAVDVVTTVGSSPF